MSPTMACLSLHIIGETPLKVNQRTFSSVLVHVVALQGEGLTIYSIKVYHPAELANDLKDSELTRNLLKREHWPAARGATRR